VHELFVLILALVLTFYLCIRYWRALLWSAAQRDLSEATRELGAWINGHPGCGSLDLVCALMKLCPSLERGGDRKLFFVRAYDAILSVPYRLTAKASGEKNRWLAAERRACSYFAAVLLDERIHKTSQWYAGQITDVAS
jgi:hypothetical protein